MILDPAPSGILVFSWRILKTQKFSVMWNFRYLINLMIHIYFLDLESNSFG